MTKRKRFAKLTINEISGVDNMAQGEGASVAIMKRAKPTQVEKRGRLTTSHSGHTHLVEMYGNESGFTSWEEGHQHPWVRNDDGSIEVGEMNGHTHDIVIKNAAGSPDGQPDPTEDNTMTTKTQKNGSGDATNTETVAKADFDALKAKLDATLKFAELSDAHKAHALTLDEGDARNAFVSKSVDDREAVIKSLNAEDPVAYTTDAGVAVRKSAGTAVIEALKSADTNARAVTKMLAERRMERLEKRASDELPHLKGEVTTKAELLGLIDGVQDETKKAAMLETLKAANEAASPAFTTLGTAAKNADVGDAEAKIEKRASEIATKDGISFEAAIQKFVTETDEGRALYAQTLS